MPGKGSLSRVADLARASALSFPGWPAWALIQAVKIFLGVWAHFERGVSR